MDAIVAQTPKFMLVFIRISAFMAFVPFFDNRNFVMNVKVGFAFILAILLFPGLDTSAWVIPSHIPGFIFAVSMEIIIGVLMGLTLLIMIFALQLTGHLVGFQMAFSMANAVDATFGENANIFSIFLVMMGTLLIITLRGDHYLLYSLSKSFTVLVPGAIAATRDLVNELARLMLKSFEIGFKVASPAVILMLAIDVTLGLIGKTASKMQIFFVGLPLKIAIGLFSFTIILGIVMGLWGKNVAEIPYEMSRVLEFMKI